MALPVLDGNQSATTLSSVVTGGEHIVAHSVVSLGTTAIANITSAVSGVNIGGTVTANINGTPSVTFGAITGSASIIGTPTVTIPQLNRVIQSVATDGVADTTLNFVKIGGHQSGSNQTAHIVHVSAGGAMSVDATDSVVSISNFPSTQTIAGTVTAQLGSNPFATIVTVQTITGLQNGNPIAFGDQLGIYELNLSAPQAYSVEAGFLAGPNFVTTTTLSLINPFSGTTLTSGNILSGVLFRRPSPYSTTNNTFRITCATSGGSPAPFTATVRAISDSYYGLDRPVSGTVTVSNSVTIGSLPNSLSIVNSSSVTKANVQYTAIAGSINSSDGASSYTMRPVAVNSSGQIYIDANPAGQSVFSNDGTSHIFVKPTPNTSVTIGSLPAISGTVTANVPLSEDTYAGNEGIRVVGNGSDGALRIGGYDPIHGGQLNLEEGGGIPVFAANQAPLPISGAVTAAAPNGSLTTRFGTPTTANTAFATSAVTNANRKYLLIQNVTTGSNVITVGIGFTPTTTQGIQLTAGAGITFESSYIPTGAVYVLSSVTASNFTILEA